MLSFMMTDYFIQNWEDIAEIVQFQVQGRLQGKEWIFRGVGSEKYDLVPSIGRADSRKSATATKTALYSEIEKQMLAEFKRRVRPYLEHEPQDDFEWLAVGQHHGLATRLLDWSLSPLVAAFFATEIKPQQGHRPVIYAANDLPPPPTDNPFQISEVCLYRPPHISPRIPAQMGVFTAYPDPIVPLPPDRIHRWFIKDWFALKVALDAAGINRASLFPGIDGTAEYVRWRYKWGWLPKEK